MAVNYLDRITKIETAIDACIGGSTTRLSAGGESVEFSAMTYDQLLKMLRDAKIGAVRAGQMSASEAGLGGAIRVRTFGS
jgi:hypothetical protein